MNPYLSHLYAALEDEGVPRGPDARLDLRWLLAHRTTVRWLHAHWPEPLYHWHREPVRLQPALSWVKLLLFASRLRIARLLGYRIVWTIHQVYPHDTTQPRLDRAGVRALARAADVLLAHDAFTAELACRELGPGIADVTVAPHGSYVGVYPPGRPSDVVRAELGLTADATVVLCFVELRGDSDVDVLLAAFSAANLPNAQLVFAGNVKIPAVAFALDAAVLSEPRIVRLPGPVQVDAVAELYGAANVAVMPRGNGGTSGSLILALSQGLPVIAADMPANRDAGVDEKSGWLFTPGDRDSLAASLSEAAVASPETRARKSAAAIAAARRLDWTVGARIVARALAGSDG
jgi:glycosyltransferase involved in cell wall biosynthesis